MSDKGKTWGPFTGRQLTTIICVLAVMILFPVGAWAVSFSNVAITDPGGVHRAKVDAAGKLAVGDGVGNLSVDGAVAPALPAKSFNFPYTLTQTSATLVHGPQTRAFGITSLTVYNTCSSTLRLSVVIHPSSGADSIPAAIIVGPQQQTHVTYPSPLVARPPAGGGVSMYVLPSASSCIYVSAVGIQS